MNLRQRAAAFAASSLLLGAVAVAGATPAHAAPEWHIDDVIDLGGSAAAAITNDATNHLIVTNPGDESVLIFDLDSLELLQTIELPGAAPTHAVVSDDGDVLYVSDLAGQEVLSFDLTVSPVVPLASTTDIDFVIGGMDYSDDFGGLIVSGYDVGAVLILDPDLSTGTAAIFDLDGPTAVDAVPGFGLFVVETDGDEVSLWSDPDTGETVAVGDEPVSARSIPVPLGDGMGWIVANKGDDSVSLVIASLDGLSVLEGPELGDEPIDALFDLVGSLIVVAHEAGASLWIGGPDGEIVLALPGPAGSFAADLETDRIFVPTLSGELVVVVFGEAEPAPTPGDGDEGEDPDVLPATGADSSALTIMLWVGAATLLLGGALIAARVIRSRRGDESDAEAQEPTGADAPAE